MRDFTAVLLNGLRDYNITGQLGLESTLDAYIERLVEVFAEVKRVLRDDGVCVINVGDSYNSTGGHTNEGGPSSCRNGRANLKEQNKVKGGHENGLKPKDLMGVPWRLAMAMQRDGWYWRAVLPWIKASCMPESCTDRPTTACEWVLLFSKAKSYYWDGDAVRQPHKGPIPLAGTTQLVEDQSGIRRWHPGELNYNHAGRNFRNTDLMFINANPQPFTLQMCGGCKAIYEASVYKELDCEGPSRVCHCGQSFKWLSHFATFPEALVEPFVKAGTSERGCCRQCGAPWVRVVEKEYGQDLSSTKHIAGGDRSIGQGCEGTQRRAHVNSTTTGWVPGCGCPGEDGDHPGSACADEDNWPVIPCTVLDCFSGTGTTGIVALAHGRKYIGMELNQDYHALAEYRIGRSQQPSTYAATDAAPAGPLFEC